MSLFVYSFNSFINFFVSLFSAFSSLEYVPDLDAGIIYGLFLNVASIASS